MHNQPVYEGCISGLCEGECGRKYKDVCPAYHKFILDMSSGRPKKVYLPDPARSQIQKTK